MTCPASRSRAVLFIERLKKPSLTPVRLCRWIGLGLELLWLPRFAICFQQVIIQFYHFRRHLSRREERDGIYLSSSSPTDSSTSLSPLSMDGQSRRFPWSCGHHRGLKLTNQGRTSPATASRQQTNKQTNKQTKLSPPVRRVASYDCCAY